MGEVGITIKIMPDGMNIDLENLKERVVETIPGGIKVTNTEIVPIAFGLKALVLDMIMGDESPDELVDRISSAEGVARAEIEKVGRLF
ncbi:MAG: elongation factor 1-beta [Candidatus Thermoplasmatota archaeon]|nr:elongation factor 1-beta [Candidatus Thermoplasmatota archaeon]